MLTVASIVKLLFWSPAYKNIPFPSDPTLAEVHAEVTDIAGMTGKERRRLLAEAGVHQRLVLPFLRAMQHLTALHGRETVEDPMYPCHRLRSPQHWSPAGEMYYTPLLGLPMSLSDESGTSRPLQPHGPTTALKSAASSASLTNGTASSAGYVGLLNQGSTCYLNSLLQALYHLSQFRSVIYAIPTLEEARQAPSPTTSGSRSIPLALQRLFCRLQQAVAPVSTTELTASFGWSDADSFIQHDIHELTRILLDNLEAKLEKTSTLPSPQKVDISGGNGAMHDGSGTRTKNAIRDLFQGVQQNYIKVEEEQYCGTRDEQFYDIQLVVKGNKNIYESFDAIIEPEILDGKNKYCLEREGKKSYHRAEKGVLFQKFPPVLLLHLTRFDFDPETGEMGKVLSRWDFYDRIDLSKYVSKEKREAPHPPGYFTYRLHSVLVHSGSDARFGHYYCFVNTRRLDDEGGVPVSSTGTQSVVGGQWYKFNDETVSKAPLKDVFGANFGGFKLNYWGAEVPHTASGYLLIYIRESDVENFMSPVPLDSVPTHVVDQLSNEAEREAQLRQERAEAHLYGRLHFTSAEDLEEHPSLLVSQAPCLQFPPQRTLRALLTDEAHGLFTEFAARQFGAESPQDVALFVVHTVEGEGTMNPMRRLGKRILPHSSVKDHCAENETFASGSRQGCIFVAPLKGESTGILATLSEERVRSLSETDQLVLTHHKFYDPFELKIKYLDSMLLPASDTITSLESFIHRCALKRGYLPVGCVSRLSPSVEENGPRFVSVSCSYGMQPRGGEMYVWQENISEPERQERVLFKSLDDFLGFHRHRVPVEIRLLQHPTFPVLCNTELSTEMTYDQLQRFVALRLHATGTNNNTSCTDGSVAAPSTPPSALLSALAPPPSHDYIRFSRHNPETNYPYFMKNRKSNNTTLKVLLTVSNSTRMNQIIYFEICPFAVTEIETSNSFQFELWQRVAPGKYVTSQQWLLLPEPPRFTMEGLFACVAESVNDGKSIAQPCDTHRQTSPAPVLLPNHLRIVDVWRSKIYNVYDLEVPITTRFEESAEYRIEAAPQPIEGVPVDDQILLHVSHFSRSGTGNVGGKIIAHSDPFSLFLCRTDSLQTVRQRIWEHLGLTEQQMEDWKLCIVHSGRTCDVVVDTTIGEQLMAFARSAFSKASDNSKNSYYEPPAPDATASPQRHADPNSTNKDRYLLTIGGGTGPLSIFQSNQRDGTQVGYLGLEHAISLSAKRGVKAREERGGLRILN